MEKARRSGPVSRMLAFWPAWLAVLAIAGWFGRKWLLIIATIVVFHPIPIPPLFQGEPQSLSEARLQDLRHFEHVRRNERSMSEETLARFDAQVMNLRQQAGDLTDAEFMLGLARAQAVVDNGHSNGAVTSMIRGFPHLPIRMAFFGDDLRVLRATASNADLLGRRVTHINEIAVEDVAARFRNAFGGPEPNFRILVPLLMETPAYLAAVGIPCADVTLRFDGDGAAFERTLAPETFATIETWTVPGDLPLTSRRDYDAQQVFRPMDAPLFQRNAAHGYWSEDLEELDAVYINLRTNMDDDSGTSLRSFARETLETLGQRSRAPRAIIVDLRFNHGGDYSLTHDLMVALGDIVGANGRVYLLTSGNTFSAAIVSIAFAKEAAPERTLIVGEAIGDRLQFWAEGWRYNLPNSGFGARYATAYYDLQHGCHGLFRCYWGAFYLFPVIVDDLDVDVQAPLTFEAYAAGRDPALEAIAIEEAARRDGL